MYHRLLLLGLLLPYLGTAQPNTPYFQQDVAYVIDVALDDRAHVLRGNYQLTYTNNSPDALREIYVHLWPNAFADNETAFARQQRRQGSTRFYFAPPEQRGGIDSLSWQVDGAPVGTRPYRDLRDVTILVLNKVIPPGGTVTVTTPFRVKIPASFSRLGHVKTSYQLTQWYPKPAVYDRRGWHPMPNLDMGEYYSEFGRFDVSLTLPENYVVGATGELQTETERAFLRERATATEARIAAGEFTADKTDNAFPESTAATKTLRYLAEGVHDFAIFADKRFHVQLGDTTLASGKTVETYVMYTDTERHLWKNALHYVNRAVRFYSDQVGEYPYPQATAVQSALSAGAGMEYPMITVIGRSGTAKDLDDVITHEVGHNWFYGILGSNERIFPWLDEGLNTFYEYRYMDRYYGGDSYRDPADELLPSFLAKHTDLSLNQAGLLLNARRGWQQSSSIDSDSMTFINYGVGSYTKPAQVLFLLENYLGKEVFDAAMRDYYATWKFKHPQPADLQAIFERAAGKPLDWAFQDLLASRKLTDYALRSIEATDAGYTVRIENMGDARAPFPLAGLKNGEVVRESWVDGFAGTTTVDFPAGDYDVLVIDPDYETLEINRRNDNIRPGGGKGDPLRPLLGAALEHTRERQLYYLPLVAGNSWDGLALGLGVHNYSLLEKPVEFALLPQYAFGSNAPVGLAQIVAHHYPDGGPVRRIDYALDAKSYHFFGNERFDYSLRFARLTPSVTFEFDHAPTATAVHRVAVLGHYIHEQRAEFSGPGEFDGLTGDGRYVGRLQYTFDDPRAINPRGLRVGLEHQRFDNAFGQPTAYTLLDVDYTFAYTYARGRQVDFRFFGGYFLQNDQRDLNFFDGSGLSISGQASTDFNYDDFYLARNEPQLFAGRQVHTREGGFKIPVGSAFASSDGNSNNLLLAVNLSADLPRDLPFRLPLRPYVDLAYVDDAAAVDFSAQLWWNAGVTLELVPDILAVHFPLLQSNNIQTLFDGAGRGGFFERVSFTLDVRELAPLRLRERVPR